MSTSQELTLFGNVQARYRGNLLKAILNGIIGYYLVRIAFGAFVFQLSLGQLNAFALPAGLLMLAGLYLLSTIFRRLLGHSVTLFENSVLVKRLGSSLALRYDEIEGITTDVRRLSKGFLQSKFIAGYTVYANGKSAFTINSDIVNWKKLSKQLKEAVIRVQVPRYLDRLHAGQTVRFTELMSGFYLKPTPMTLALNAQGVQVNDGAVASWESAKITVEADDWNNLVTRLRTGGQRIEFLTEASPSAMMAYEVIKAYLQTNRKTTEQNTASLIYRTVGNTHES